MSVYTELTHADISAILSDYNLGNLSAFEGIAAGIENSNFFITTQGENTERYVLTIFERMDASELPYFMHLMKYLAANGLSCPDVMQRQDDSLLFEIQGKQGCIVSCLSGKTLDELNEVQLTGSGQALAQLHLAGADFKKRRSNPTGSTWLAEKVDAVLEQTAAVYGQDAAGLLSDELISSVPVSGIHYHPVLFTAICSLIIFYSRASRCPALLISTMPTMLPMPWILPSRSMHRQYC